MTKIIPFNPVLKSGYEIKSDVQPKVKLEQPNDSFEFQDYELDEETNVKKTKSLTPKLPQSQLLSKAWDNYDKALRIRDRVAKLLVKAQANNYEDMLDSKGNLITFKEDILGRSVMVECDENARDKRRTTFYKDNGKIIKISALPHTQIVFFEYKNGYTEITKMTKPNFFGKYTSEVYSYENGRPISYSKYKNSVYSDGELTETCEF